MIRGESAAAGADAQLISAVAATGIGAAAMLGVSAAVSGALAPAIVAAAIFGPALVLIVAMGWVEPLGLLVLTLPLPAFYSTDAFRLPPILLVSALVVFGWFMGRGRDRRPLIARRGAMASLSALLGAVLVATVFADQIGPALREAANFLLFVGLFALTLDIVARRPDRADTLMSWVAVAAAVAGAAAVLEAAGVIPGEFPLANTSAFRAAGGFGGPTELAMFLAVALPLTLHRARTAVSPLGRVLGGGALVLTGLGLVATFSRGSWLAILVGSAVLLLVGERRTALRFWLGGIAAAAAFDLLSGGALSTRIAGTPSDPLVVQRLLLTGVGLLIFQQNPIVGVGPGGFGEALESFGPQVSGLFDFVGAAHNGYVHVAAEMGIVGLAAFVYFVGSTWIALVRGYRASRASAQQRDLSLRLALLWSFTTACLVSVFEWPFAHGVGELIVIVAAAGRALGPDVVTGDAWGVAESAERRSPTVA